MDEEYLTLKKWLEDTRDVPLEAMDAFFNARLGDYEEHMAHWSAHYQWMADLLPEGITSLLDIGCGTGLELDCIFRRFPTLSVTGIDLAEDMLAVLRKKHGDKALTLCRADYFTCSLPKNAFDCVVSFETLHHYTAEQKQPLFARICRSLKPGGIYLECDYIAATQAIEDLVFTECARRRQRDGIAPGDFVHFDTPLTLEHEMDAMRRAGFSSVEAVGFLEGDSNTAMILCKK